MLETLRKGAGTWIAKIFIALLVLSFAVWGIADIFGGFGARDIATVGKTKISDEEFRQAFETQISNLSARFGRRLSTQQAQQMGIDRQVLSSLIGAAALSQQAQELNLGITDKAIALTIQKDPSFRGLDGQFSRTRFIELLRTNGLSERGYIYRQRDAQIRNQIINALFSSLKLPDVYIDAVNRFRQEKRVLKYFVIPASKAGKIADSNDENLKKFYESHRRKFTAPEYRKIGLLIVKPEKIKNAIKIGDEEVKAAYDTNPERFNEPEKRRVQQIAFQSEADADKAYADLKGGKSFEAVALANGFSKTEIDLGLIDAGQLADKNIRAAAFALKKAAFSKPVKGKLATVLLKVGKIKPAVKGNFTAVKAKIKDEIRLERAQNKIEDMLDQIEDERAAGATLAEIAEKLTVEYRLIEASDQFGNDQTGKPLKDIPQLARVTQIAFASDVGVETDAIEIGEGGYQWVEVLNVIPQTLKDFDLIKAEIKKEYIETETAKALRKFASELIKRLKNGEPIKKLAGSIRLNVKTSKPLRRGEKDAGLSTAVVNQSFTLAKGGFGNGSGEKVGTRIVFQLSDIKAPEPLKAVRAEKLRAQLSQSVLADMLAQFVGGLQAYYNVNVNESVFNRLTGRDQS